LSKGDLITLYFAYFTDMAISTLKDSWNKSRLAKRRFTVPVYKDKHDRRSWMEAQIKKYLARAQILADTLNNTWDEPLDVHKARYLLDRIKEQKKLPEHLIDFPILEPVAAIASLYREDDDESRKRKLCMLVDVGAGTVDFALFAIWWKDNERRMKILDVDAIPIAGNDLDTILKEFILADAGIDKNIDDRYRLAAATLNRDIRIYKEMLFINGEVKYEISGRKGTIKCDKFLKYSKINNFEKMIHEKFDEVIKRTELSWIDDMAKGILNIFFTGGGASLPMIKSLGDDREIIIDGSRIRCISAEQIPLWIKNDTEFEHLEEEYPQLAVAIGGSSRHIPAVIEGIWKDFGGLDVPGGWKPPTPAMKGT